jgi:hypothetical protein
MRETNVGLLEGLLAGGGGLAALTDTFSATPAPNHVVAQLIMHVTPLPRAPPAPLPPCPPQVEKAPLESYADVGGLEPQIQEIKEAVELPLTHPELYEDIGIKPPKVGKGVLGAGRRLGWAAAAGSRTWAGRTRGGSSFQKPGG